MGENERTVAVLGASPKPERYSNRALRMLAEHGFRAIPIHPAQETIEGLAVAPSPDAIQEPVDTLTVYVSPEVSSGLSESIRKLGPRRVIFNPGAENPDLAAELEAAGIAVQEACTLVLLRTGQF